MGVTVLAYNHGLGEYLRECLDAWLQEKESKFINRIKVGFYDHLPFTM